MWPMKHFLAAGSMVIGVILLAGCEAATPKADPAEDIATPETVIDLVGIWTADSTNDAGNLVTETYVLYDDQTFTHETVERAAASFVHRARSRSVADVGQLVPATNDDVLSQTLVYGTWEAKPDESDDGSGMVVLQVTACGDVDCSDTDVAIGDTITLDYDTDDAGEIRIEVVPDTPATRTVLPPSVTAQIPSVDVLIGESVTVTFSEYFHAATSYSAVSAAIDQLGVSVAGDVLTLDPLAVTATPVVVTVTGANEGGEETITFSVSVVAAESEQTDAEKLIGTWEWTDGDVRHILTFTKTRWIDYRVGDDDADSGTWRVSGSTITRVTTGGTVDKAFEFATGELMMEPWDYDEPDDPISYTRITDPVPSPLRGRWAGRIGTFSFSFQFGAGGAFSYRADNDDNPADTAVFTATWRDAGNYTAYLTNQRVSQWNPAGLPDVLAQTLRLAYAPTHRSDQILMSSYWREQEKDANGTWMDRSGLPYGHYQFVLTRQ